MKINIMIVPVKKLIIVFFLLCAIPVCCAEELNVIENDYDSIFEEIHETITNTTDTVSHLNDKGRFSAIQDEVDDAMDAEYTIFEGFNKSRKEDIQKIEGPLFSRIMKQDITRTDVPSYLLRQESTFFFDKGPLKKIQVIGAYNGGLNFLWKDQKYQYTEYDNNFMQVGALGQLADEQTDFKVLFNLRPAKGLNYMQNFVADAYLVNNRIPHHKLIVGHSRNAVGFEGAMSSYILPFATRSQISRNFGSTRATGVKVIGDYSLIDYSVAANSSDRFFHEFFPGAEFTGWVNLKPLGKTNGKYGRLVVGGGVNTGRNHTDYTVGGLYVGYRYKKLYANFEYASADGYNGRQISTKKANGFYGTIGYKINPRLQLIARYDRFDPDKDKSNDVRQEITAGINWFIKGQAIKLILNYVFCNNQNSPDSHRLIIATQFLL